MGKLSGFHGNSNLQITAVAITLISLIFFSSVSSPLSETYLGAEARPAGTTDLQGRIDELNTNVQDIAKKLREVRGEKVPNQYIVVLKDNNLLSSGTIRSLAGEAVNQGAALRHIYDNAIGGFAIKVPNEKALEAILKIPEVDYVEPDIKVKAFIQSLSTGIDRVDADLSSTKSGNGSGVVNADIGILDTGIDLSHPDLNVYREVTFVSGTSSGNDDNGHGTAVAGIAAAKDDSEGVVGIAPGARLWSIKVLDSNGNGFISDIIEGVDYVTQHADEIDVVNLSFGGDGSNIALRTAIINSVASGVTYAAAAGNGAKDASSVIPASYPEVIAVSAIVDTDGKCGGISKPTTAGSDDTLADFSNFGSVVDMAAPGVPIKTTTRGSTYISSFSGTSASTPHITGAAALYISENPGATPSNIINALRDSGSSSATICDGNGHGYFTGDPDNNAEPLLYTAVQDTTSCTTTLPISGVTASGNDGNLPSNVLDNNLNTRWSSLGVGQFIRADLASTQNICSVDIAWYKGNERAYNFVIATSTDGTTFTNKLTSTSSGITLNSEKYTIPATDARYVRITVNGNTANSWASMTELDVFGSGSSPPPPPDCTTTLPIGTVTASGNDGNLPSNVIDNNLNTRWSSLGVGQFITADLGSTQNICSVDIAWYKGNERAYNFVIATSTDGTTFTNKLTSTSSGITLNSEKYTIPATDARYVRITVNGNTANSWASMTELDVFGSGSAPPLSDCTTTLPIGTVTASGNDGNLPSNVIDNNLNTRWSSLGVGQFITADLGSTQNICSVDIAWYKGNERAYNFVIATSTDGTTFTNKLTSTSSGITLNSEKYTIPATDARYVRITVNGNTANSWASMTELDVFGSGSASSSSLYNYGPSLTLSGPSG